MPRSDDELLKFVMKVMDERDLRYQQRFEAQSTAIKDALIAAEKAVTKAEVATERRFESVNEFRQTLSDQAAKFVTRTEFHAIIVTLVSVVGLVLAAIHYAH